MNKAIAPKLKSLRLIAPISGTAYPLSHAADPLVIQGLLGAGVIIEPVGSRVVAPCDGTITSIAATGHQLTITNKYGVVIKLIIGFDGLSTHGVGYNKKIQCGDLVSQGQTLVELDTLKLKTQLQSLNVVTLVTKGALKMVPKLGIKRGGEDDILTLVIKAQIKETP